jgi:hypothetical protein
MGKIFPAVCVDVFDGILGNMRYSLSTVPGLEGNNECITLTHNSVASSGSNPNETF